MDANMKYVLPSFSMAGDSTRLPPSNFHEKTSVVGLVKSSERATMRRPYLRCRTNPSKRQPPGGIFSEVAKKEAQTSSVSRYPLPSSSLNNPMSRLSLPSLSSRKVSSNGPSRLLNGHNHSRLKASQVLILPTDAVPRRYRNPRLAIAATVHMHPEHIFFGLVIINDLGPFNYTVRAKVS